jgi:hypothetical protein
MLVYSIGILVGMAIAGGMIWSDLETSLFDSGISPDSPLRLNCPIAITTDEIGTVSANIKNTTEKEKSFFVRTHISEGYLSLMREVNQKISVPAGQTEKLSWEISAEDAVYNRVVMFRVYVSPSYPIPSQGNFCGVLVLNTPLLTGTQVFILLLVTSLAGVIIGSILWRKANPTMTDNLLSLTNAMRALAVIIFIMILISYFGLWVLGVLLFAVSILLMGIILGRYYAIRD